MKFIKKLSLAIVALCLYQNSICGDLGHKVSIDLQDKFFYAVRKGDQIQIQSLLSKQLDIDFKDCYGDTALIIAAREGHLNALRTLLANGASINKRGSRYDTALIAATKKNNLFIVEELLKNDADPDVQNVVKDTALLVAAREDYLPIAKKLLNSDANPDIKDENGYNAVSCAVQNNNVQMLTELLKAGTEIFIHEHDIPSLIKKIELSCSGKWLEEVLDETFKSEYSEIVSMLRLVVKPLAYLQADIDCNSSNNRIEILKPNNNNSINNLIFIYLFNWFMRRIKNEALIGLKADVLSEIRHSQTQSAPRLRRAPDIHPGDKSPGILATENKEEKGVLNISPNQRRILLTFISKISKKYNFKYELLSKKFPIELVNQIILETFYSDSPLIAKYFTQVDSIKIKMKSGKVMFLRQLLFDEMYNDILLRKERKNKALAKLKNRYESRFSQLLQIAKERAKEKIVYKLFFCSVD